MKTVSCRETGWAGVMAALAWSAEELTTLREVWPRGRARKADLERLFPGRSWSGIVQKARLEKIDHPGFKRWTAADDERLGRLYATDDRAALCEQFAGHTWEAIAKRANELGCIADRAKNESKIPVIRELRRIRRSQRLKTDVVAEKFGGYGSTLSAWETGAKVPNLRGFLDWVDALNLEIVLHRKGVAAQQAVVLLETPGRHRLMARTASASARRAG